MGGFCYTWHHFVFSLMKHFFLVLLLLFRSLFFHESNKFHIAACLDSEWIPESDWHCPNCRDNFQHVSKAAAGGSSSIARPIVIRLTREFKAPEIEIGGCVLCRCVALAFIFHSFLCTMLGCYQVTIYLFYFLFFYFLGSASFSM